MGGLVLTMTFPKQAAERWDMKHGLPTSRSGCDTCKPEGFMTRRNIHFITEIANRPLSNLRMWYIIHPIDLPPVTMRWFPLVLALGLLDYIRELLIPSLSISLTSLGLLKNSFKVLIGFLRGLDLCFRTHLLSQERSVLAPKRIHPCSFQEITLLL